MGVKPEILSLAGYAPTYVTFAVSVGMKYKTGPPTLE